MVYKVASILTNRLVTSLNGMKYKDLFKKNFSKNTILRARSNLPRSGSFGLGHRFHFLKVSLKF